MDYPNFYQNLEEVNFRLVDTVVLYDDDPAYIHRASEHRDGTIRLHISILPNQIGVRRDRDEDDVDDEDEMDEPNTVRKLITSPKFKMFRPFKMGFMNDFSLDPNAKYTTRLPARRSKQGLFGESFASTSLKDDPRGVPKENFRTVIGRVPFAEMVKGQYPELIEVLDTLHEDTSIAVDREFAIKRDRLGLDYLYFKTDKVGLVRRGEVLLGNRFGYLREAIISCNKLPNNVSTL